MCSFFGINPIHRRAFSYFSTSTVVSIPPLKIIVISVLLLTFIHSISFLTSMSLYSASSHELLSISCSALVIRVLLFLSILLFSFRTFSRELSFCSSAYIFWNCSSIVSSSIIGLEKAEFKPYNKNV